MLECAFMKINIFCIPSLLHQGRAVPSKMPTRHESRNFSIDFSSFSFYVFFGFVTLGGVAMVLVTHDDSGADSP